MSMVHAKHRTVPSVPPDSSAPRKVRRGRRPSALPYALLVPALLVLALVVGYPLVRLGVISTQGYGLRALFTGRPESVGAANYQELWLNPALVSTLVRTLVFAGSLAAGTLLIGLAVAHLMAAVGPRMRTAVTLSLISAWAMPNVASTLVWQWLFQPTYGVVNWLLTAVGIGDYQQHSWFSDPNEAFAVIWLLVVWQAVPFVALTLYAGISQIPREYYEAAACDGANALQRLRVITFPCLRPILLLVGILSVIWDFNVFNQIWLLTGGGPGDATTTIGIWSFQRAFAAQDYGQGAAIAIASVLLLMTMTGYYVRRLIRAGEAL
ncbi:carbohydrate ABC transporter permease [Acrocarpospora catenulata]|uniref:carbohydrate ABC transporter permease n=1 Tax=Acrocarpospora catenulata TaxID=2836182 RepID=UPI001BD992C8|nr:sugar ABC transporter permease [Acrocarpospora catenulata]